MLTRLSRSGGQESSTSLGTGPEPAEIRPESGLSSETVVVGERVFHISIDGLLDLLGVSLRAYPSGLKHLVSDLVGVISEHSQRRVVELPFRCVSDIVAT